jgi:hypothetical protein
MGNNSWFNNNPYRSDVSHIPYTHYESRPLYDNKIVFIYGSIEKKCNLFKKSLADLIAHNQKDVCYRKDSPILGYNIVSGIPFKDDILSGTDIYSLHLLNSVFKYLLSYQDRTLSDSDIETFTNTNLDVMEEYLRNSVKEDNVDLLTYPGELVEVKAIDSDFESNYPYEVNTLDTGVPTDIYYKIKNISESMTAVIVYNGFFDHLFKDNNINHFIRHLVLKMHEFMTIQDIANLNIFKAYIKTL